MKIALTKRAEIASEDSSPSAAIPLKLGTATGMSRAAMRALEAAFGQPFSLVDADTGEVSSAASNELSVDLYSRLALIQQVVNRGAPEIIEHEAPISVLVAPLGALGAKRGLAAVGVLLNMPIDREAQIASAAKLLGVDAGRAFEWAKGREAWSARVMLRLAEGTIENLVQRVQLTHLQHEINEAVGHARDTYVELGLLHRLVRNLDVANDAGQLWERAVEWLADAVPAQCVVAVVNRGPVDPASVVRGDSRVIARGECSLAEPEILSLVDRLGDAAKRPLLMNRSHTSGPTWAFPLVRELACAPIMQGSQIDGWLLAVNHLGDSDSCICEFGSAEVRLIDSVGMILGVHRSNVQLFHRQAELFSASVRALTSAIDAKDAYTCGHSERVARVAVCLAEELGLDSEQLNTIYLGGLLHDIGKIGVDDCVLNKPGALTAEEFAKIKQHPQLGYDILRCVRPLERILPIVLHHHEAWNGAGYPHGLKGEATPLLAHITAVADAFDAMSSDRPYRLGMPDDKLDEIFRNGAGKQWDPAVIDAFFAARERIRQAAHDDTVGAVPLDPLQWLN